MLSDAGSNAMVGPNLNEIRPDIQRIIMAVRNGIGVMPAMEGILTDEEIEAVAHYTSCLLYTSPSPRDATLSRMPSSA